MKFRSKLTLILSSLFLISSMTIQARQNGIKIGETEVEFFQSNADNANGRTVLILPGGGYSRHAMDHEGYAWVPFFNDLGLNVAVLKYKLPDGNAEIPLNDVKKTIGTLKEKSTELNINPSEIGIMGFSAGGHLASTYATHSEGQDTPAFQILFYPVISLDSSLTHQGSRDNFLGNDQSEERVILYSNELQVDNNTPPAILFHSDDDKGVNPENSIKYYRALKKEGIPASLHIYPVGGHGWGFHESFPYHSAVLQELATWLNNLNIRNQ